MNIKRVLIVAAHYDDAEYSCGGMMQRHEAHLLITHRHTKREPEQRNASEMIGAKFHSQHFGIHGPRERVLLLTDAMRHIEPDLVITHWPDDTHQEHVATAQIVASAMRGSSAALAYMYSPSSLRFEPNVLIEMTPEQWQLKLDALACHVSQADKPYFDHAALAILAQSWAVRWRLPLAYYEPYHITRCVIT